MRRAVRTGGLVLLVVASFAAGWVRLPYYSLGPGPARDVLPLIHIDGARTYVSSGHLVLTTVRFAQVTPLGALVAWIDPDQTVVADEVLYPPGLTPSEEAQRAVSQMDQSQLDAAVVVLTSLTDYPTEHAPGALIEQVGEGCPADGKLFTGDLIRRIGDEEIDSADEASAVLDDVGIGASVSFEVEAEGETHHVEVSKGRCPGVRRSLFGISIVEPFPFGIAIESDDVGGPSAGLMWALGLYDLLTRGDLTRGRTIAGTGEIDGDGHVLPIGAIDDKVIGAREAGADILLVPRRNARQIAGADTDGMRVIPVATFEDALRALGTPEPTA